MTLPSDKTSVDAWAAYVADTHYGPNLRSSQQARRILTNFVTHLRVIHLCSPMPVGLLRQADIDSYVAECKQLGNSASTINTKLCVIAKLLDTISQNVKLPFTPKLPFQSRQKQRKWWLNEEQAPKLLAWLRAHPWNTDTKILHALADYIEWTRETGLRVEETLRLLPSDFVNDYTSLVVPGTKNQRSEARIAISKQATAIIKRRRALGVSADSPRLFNIPYRELHAAWGKCRVYLGVQDEPTSTLKSLRRSFAAEMMFRGMDASMLKSMMRHDSLKTTMGYLELVGIADNDRVRNFLDWDKPASKPTGDDLAFALALAIALGGVSTKL